MTSSKQIILYSVSLLIVVFDRIKGDEAYFEDLKNGITPDVVRAEDIMPTGANLVVKYPNVTTELGSKLTPAQTKDQPSVAWEADDGKYYTLSMTDPDAPSRNDPRFREWQHWLVVNIPGNRLSEGEVLTEYKGPSPPKGSGFHRYVFLLMEQPKGKQPFNEPFKSKNESKMRMNFNTMDFIDKHDFGKLIVIDGYYFEAESEENSNEDED